MNIYRKLFCILLFSQTLLLVSYADTNGIWTYAEDIEAGVFGADENNPANSNYTFNDIVYFNKNVFSDAQIYSKKFIDIEDSNYFLNPSGQSNLYGIKANRYYSSDGDTSYFVNPSGDSYVNNLDVADTLRVDNIVFGDGVIVGPGHGGNNANPSINYINDGDNDDTNELQKLRCVTGFMENGNTNGNNVKITNQQNIAVPSWSNVFSADTFSGGEDRWGLICRGDWVNTGCSNAWLRDQGGYDADVWQANNGCFSDNEEIWSRGRVYTTCCKLS